MSSLQSTSISTLAEELVQNITNQGVNKNNIPSGFQFLDEEFGGLTLGDLVVIGGRPAMGKTLFAVNLIATLSNTIPVLYFSFDITPATLAARIISFKTKIPVDKILSNQLIKADQELIREESKKLENNKLHVSEIGLGNIDKIIAQINEHVNEQQTKVVVIDYLQLIGEGKYSSGREAEIGHICRTLKRCAKELNICIVLLSHLSRAVETRNYSKKPQLSDLRDSGTIEQTADKVLLLYRPEYYLIEELDDDAGTPADSLLLVYVAKNKNGKMGVSYFKRNYQFTEFKSIRNPAEHFDFDEGRLHELNLPDRTENENEVPF